VPVKPLPENDLTSDLKQFGDINPEMGYTRLFFAFQRVNRTMMPGIERVLKEAGIADPIWYEILLAADEAGGPGVQMLALQRRLFVPQYALSRHVARMEKAGLIRRESVQGAGRGQIVHVTDRARGLHEQIWQVYRGMIVTAMEERLSTAEAYQALRLMNRLYP
jgi:DNA-binding MarR family transcriptional regulator